MQRVKNPKKNLKTKNFEINSASKTRGHTWKLKKKINTDLQHHFSQIVYQLVEQIGR